MSHGSLWERLVRGTHWCWTAERFRAALPADLDATVMHWQLTDRYHAKQGRSTARVRLDAPGGALSVYLKRHHRLPWLTRLAATLDPAGHRAPAAAEWAHLERVRALGIAVPEVVAVGERIGPWGRVQGYLMVAELTGWLPLHEAIPARKAALDPRHFAAWKRALAAELAAIAATLHRARAFHKDFYLCHVFLDPAGRRLALIDLHRLGEHRLTAFRWRWKDLGQLLFSTCGVDGIDDRDRLRFWKAYRAATGLRGARWQARRIRAKAARYLAHNRPGRAAGDP